ncbi:Zn-ribbon domain-containing OB-fold protein [Halobium salinum]|uniref:Zn-ribbon domain-containing OB-fold protein n=1 Tax=Halobium salinum TaxID=1364940 RepID=A0ABD5PCY3_9EURY|nr:Zn-ribbon domain-containing OB-fold protein [Halobium salinum]
MSGDDASPRDAGYDDWLDALAAGDGYYLACENGHGSLPPRRVCPHCGSSALSEVDLPDSGNVETFTVVHVAAPSFVDDAPYVTAVVDFGDVRLTGVVRDVAPEDVTVGTAVGVDVGTKTTDGERLVVFHPR